MLLSQRLAIILAATLAVLLFAILFDYAVRLPAILRLAILLAGLAALAAALWKRILSAFQFSPSLTQIALRAETVLPAVTGRLASSVEFASAGVASTNALAARSVRDLQDRLAGASLSAVLRKSRTRASLAVFCAIAALCIVLTAWKPAEASLGLTRLFVPFSAQQWPARTGVDSLMYQVLVRNNAYPRGTALPLRARVTKGPDNQPVEAHIRFKKDDRFEDWQTIELTWQGHAFLDGAIHERLVDTSAQALEIYFTTDDSSTDTESITLVPPPAVTRASVDIAPPAYAAGAVPLQAELGPGTDKRSITDTPMLVGSLARLTLSLNKPITPPQDSQLETWLRQTFTWPDDQPAPAFSTQDDGETWSLLWTLQQTTSLNLHLYDEYGLANPEPIAYRINTVEDRPPAVVILEPQADQALTANASVSLHAQATDDIGLAAIGFFADVQPKSPAAAPQQIQSSPDIASAHAWSEHSPIQETAVESSSMSSSIDLAALKLAEGDVVQVIASATDAFGLNGAAPHVSYSPPRRLRIISDIDMATQLRRQFAVIRQNAIRIEAMQAELQDEIAADSVKPGVDRAQAQIAERIAAQRQSVESVRQSVADNRLNDDQLNELVSQAGDIAEHAGRAATRATDLLQQRMKSSAHSPTADTSPADTPSRSGRSSPQSQSQSPATRQRQSPQPPSQPAQPGAAQPSQPTAADQPAPQPPAADAPQHQHAEPRPEDQPITDAQQEVRDELADLIQLLDRDEDTWVITHQLENLIQQQTRLQQQTARAGERTVGQTPEELSDTDRSALDQIARKQDELRQSAGESVEQMRARADALEQFDPQSAQAMRNAAAAAEQQQLEQLMQRAAQQVQQNQMQSAAGSQQQSMETMQRMLQALQDTRQARTQELLRNLESLVQSIQRLLTIQENQIVALEQAIPAADFSELDRALIRLSQNTLAVADEARAAGSETRRIARTLERAADAQGSAIASLRSTPVNPPDVRAAEDRSLELLKQALAQARDSQKKAEEENVRNQREDLKNHYRKFAEQQVALREQTIALGPAGELDRRRLVDARRISADQETLRQALADLRATTAEIAQAPVFSHAHDLIDRWCAAVRDDLAQGAVGPRVTDRQQLIADALGRLISAVEESISPPDEFANNQNNAGGDQQGGSQQGGQQPLIPPVAEIKLLHGLQEQIYQRTRALDAQVSLPAQDRAALLQELAQHQRDLHDLGTQVLENLQQQAENPAGEQLAPPREIPQLNHRPARYNMEPTR